MTTTSTGGDDVQLVGRYPGKVERVEIVTDR